MARQSLGVEDIEILVHISAPCRVADDAAYRRLAQAYLAFEPRRATAVFPPRIEDGHGRQQAPQQQQQQQQGSFSPRPDPAEEPAGSLQQPLIIESQELSFDGALGNQGSFRARNAASTVQAPSTAPSPAKSWHSPRSHISDSYPLPDVDLLDTSPTRALEKCFQGFAPPSSSSVSGPPSSPLQPRARAPSVELQLQAGCVDIPSSIPVPHSQDRTLDGAAKIIPVTPMVPGGLHILGKRKAPATEADDQTVIDKTCLPSSQATHVSDSFSQRAESAPPASKRPRAVPSDPGLARSSSDVGPQRTRAASSAAAPRLPPRPPPPPSAPPDSDADDILEIQPPSPPPGIANLQPADLVSEKLHQLIIKLSSRFRADRKRAMDPFERGYWLLDCTGWTSATRRSTWSFLTHYLRRGLAGWGVWCRRDAAHDWLRLYCWGHVAEHTYFLLYIASERHVNTCGARWFGADGELVLEVLPSAKTVAGAGVR